MRYVCRGKHWTKACSPGKRMRSQSKEKEGERSSGHIKLKRGGREMEGRG